MTREKELLLGTDALCVNPVSRVFSKRIKANIYALMVLPRRILCSCSILLETHPRKGKLAAISQLCGMACVSGVGTS